MSRVYSVAAGLFHTLTFVLCAGWGYLFATEDPDALSKTGQALVVLLAFGLVAVQMALGLLIAAVIIVRACRPRPVWVWTFVASVSITGLATAVGWIGFLAWAIT